MSRIYRTKVVIASGLMALGASCAALVTASSASSATAPAPGVTATHISLGSLIDQSGMASASFAPYQYGARAYFDMVNAAGGVNGRQISIDHTIDVGDADLRPTNAQILVSQKVFAVVGYASGLTSSGLKYLATTATPIFGFNTGDGWQGPKNFFPAYGSALNYTTSTSDFAYVASQVLPKGVAPKIGIIALGFSTSDLECGMDPKTFGVLPSWAANLKKMGASVAYSNYVESITGGNNFSTDVTKMKARGVNFVVSCMDGTDNVALSTAMANGGLGTVKQFWEDGYNQTLLTQNSAVMKNVFVMIQHVPFEDTAVPGMALYVSTMNETFANGDSGKAHTNDEAAMQGWMGANLFVQGLRAAGANPTQAAVAAAINKITADYGGPNGGVAAPTNWTIAHTKVTSPGCDLFVKSDGQPSPKFVPAFTNSVSKIWSCFPMTGISNTPVAAPKGTPGA